MRWLYSEGLPVPRLYAFGTEIDRGFLLMTRVSGRRCTTFEPYVEMFATFLAQLHQRIPSNAVRQVLPDVAIATELERLSEIAHRCNDGGLIEAINDLLAEEVETYPPCVLHGDPQFANVLCNARGITALLDWENSALGDPRWDVARAVNWLRAQRAEPIASRFRASYENQIGRALPDMSFWEALAAAQNWGVTSWIRASAASPSLAETLRPQIEAWRGQTWRALTRLLYYEGERSTDSIQPSTQGPQTDVDVQPLTA
jgi:aminoglycoside phosphotransferase (APT) family kinase protein